ncbi:MAG: DNA translocase FtsK [Roseburia sp.]|nr:DNA translocase FtsK [Roseburia sp.]MCM1099254.1 DNA translocase FtsK [Ruminococcus flavefaciens]
MAGSTGRRTSSSNKKSAGTSRAKGNTKKADQQQRAADSALFHEIGLIALFAAMVILFCCNFGIIGPVGDAVSGFLFGVFGLTAYAAPVLLFVAVAFWFANEGSPTAVRKLIAGFVLFLMLGVVCDLVVKNSAAMESYAVKTLYESSRDTKSGGGVLSGSISYLLQHYLETIGTVLVVLLCTVVSLILLTERSLLTSVKNGGSRMREMSREDSERRRENAAQRRLAQEEQRARRDEERRLRAEGREEERRLRTEEKENQRILRMEKKVSGVMLDTALTKPGEQQRRRDDIHEIMYSEETADPAEGQASDEEFGIDFEKIRIRSMHQVTLNELTEEGEEFCGEESEGVEEFPEEDPWRREEFPESQKQEGAAESESRRRDEFQKKEVLTEPPIRIHKEGMNEDSPEKARSADRLSSEKRQTASEAQKPSVQAVKLIPKKYVFPPLSKLKKGVTATGDSTRELKETAIRLQQTLSTFGVRVTITDISQGPSVTRYELQPEQGVKVSKIVGLSDDIKLNLAATDIRIEAPIPGKAAIGIEVPNKENMPVALRDLLESREFKDFKSNIAFAVGKDIAGKVVVADIAKMPHMLIAGATGSGKSVCINTLIMSILYKAHPDDVKLIMVDPKVVELSVYNGIPHLLIPVVTDPKKASAALHWGVSEMEDRYRRFADYNVRDLKGYNARVEALRESGGEEIPAKMPQIVIIVDELADLMMVCPGEVEESICRLAQLARAAGIHLIIATQRPSVDVITGLIKANMPSRVAFSVSSGVDSRTILDMNGAEKLLGKGDMLFYPQGYSKPARIQGAFVSDGEVSDVVDFLKNQALGNVYAEDVEEKIKSLGSGAPGGGGDGSGSQLDELFEKAGRFIIEKDKASIGMLQRVLKVGFNRAARIMDQLCEYGVVGEEEGTKPRKILMSPEQFEQLVEDFV